MVGPEEGRRLVFLLAFGAKTTPFMRLWPLVFGLLCFSREGSSSSTCHRTCDCGGTSSLSIAPSASLCGAGALGSV